MKTPIPFVLALSVLTGCVTQQPVERTADAVHESLDGVRSMLFGKKSQPSEPNPTAAPKKPASPPVDPQVVVSPKPAVVPVTTVPPTAAPTPTPEPSTPRVPPSERFSGEVTQRVAMQAVDEQSVQKLYPELRAVRMNADYSTLVNDPLVMKAALPNTQLRLPSGRRVIVASGHDTTEDLAARGATTTAIKSVQDSLSGWPDQAVADWVRAGRQVGRWSDESGRQYVAVSLEYPNEQWLEKWRQEQDRLVAERQRVAEQQRRAAELARQQRLQAERVQLLHALEDHDRQIAHLYSVAIAESESDRLRLRRDLSSLQRDEQRAVSRVADYESDVNTYKIRIGGDTVGSIVNGRISRTLERNIERLSQYESRASEARSQLATIRQNIAKVEKSIQTVHVNTPVWPQVRQHLTERQILANHIRQLGGSPPPQPNLTIPVAPVNSSRVRTFR